MEPKPKPEADIDHRICSHSGRSHLDTLISWLALPFALVAVILMHQGAILPDPRLERDQ